VNAGVIHRGSTDGMRHFSLDCDTGGHWSVAGAQRPHGCFDDLASALDFARRDSDAAEAVIELRVGGLYVCVHQPKGWPQRMCGSPRAA